MESLWFRGAPKANSALAGVRQFPKALPVRAEHTWRLCPQAAQHPLEQLQNRLSGVCGRSCGVYFQLGGWVGWFFAVFRQHGKDRRAVRQTVPHPRQNWPLRAVQEDSGGKKSALCLRSLNLEKGENSPNLL